MLSVENLECRYGKVAAVRGLTLEVRKGELVSLVGANGAGKTTTLKAISGVLAPAGGRIVFEGEDLTRASARRVLELGIAHCPEGRRVFPYMTVRENLEMGAYTVSDKAEIERGVKQAVELFPRLGERMTQLGGTLSGGEQQMLAIARALMSKPKLLLLDEPSLGIAPVLVDQIFEAIGRIREQGMTILLVEQNTRRALAAAQRAYVLVTGEVALSGDAADLAEDPRVQGAYLGEAAH